MIGHFVCHPLGERRLLEMAQPTFVVIEHPSGFAERTSVEEIRLKFDMSLDEYRYFVATEPDGAAARNARRKKRQIAVMDKAAGRIEVPKDATLANFELVGTTPQDRQSVVSEVSQREGIRGFRTRKKVNPTPLEHVLTEEERREIFIPKGPYRPGFASRGGPAAAYNYVPVPASAKQPTKKRDGVDFGTSFVERLIKSTPAKGSGDSQRSRWEYKLLDAYFALYERSWSMWPTLFPWLDMSHIAETASAYGCALRWDWQSRIDFLNESKLEWSLDELKYLIDWYPEYQDNHNEQNIFAGKKPFVEVQAIAKALRLPSKRDLTALGKHAQFLAKLH